MFRTIKGHHSSLIDDSLLNFLLSFVGSLPVGSSPKLVGVVGVHSGSPESSDFLQIVGLEDLDVVTKFVGNSESHAIFTEGDPSWEGTNFRLGQLSETVAPLVVVGVFVLDNVSGGVESVSKRDIDVVHLINQNIGTSPVHIGFENFLAFDFFESLILLLPLKNGEGGGVGAHNVHETSLFGESEIVGSESSFEGVKDLDSILPLPKSVVVDMVPSSINGKDKVIFESVLIDCFNLGVVLAPVVNMSRTLWLETHRNFMFENSPVHFSNANRDSRAN